MKVVLCIALLTVSFSGLSQNATRAQAQKTKILTKYLWKNEDSTGNSKAPSGLFFSGEKDLRGYKGSFTLHYGDYGMGWWWADKKATSLTLLLRYSATSWDTLRLTNVRVTEKFLTADFRYSRWGKPITGKMRHVVLMTQEEANREPRELQAIEQ
jgi:hypothetical protein